MDEQQADLILRDIEDKLFTHFHRFIDPEVIAVLNNPDASHLEIHRVLTYDLRSDAWPGKCSVLISSCVLTIKNGACRIFISATAAQILRATDKW